MRFRLLAALLTLSALVLFQVEGLWASSACSTEMEMPVAPGVVDGGTHAGHGPVGQPGEPHDHEERGPQSPDCPLVPVGAASCVGGVALLSTSDEPAMDSSEEGLALTSSDHAKDLLLAVSLLRPPQA